MSKRIITIGRQFGSGGHEIGEKLAKKLNIPLYDRNLVEKAVEELNLDKADAVSIDESVLRNFAMSFQNFFGTSTPYYLVEGGSLSDQVYQAQCRIIEELADQGSCVFVGRCADHVLRKRDDVLKVFICADAETKIRRVMRVRNMVREKAEPTIKEMDKKRRNYYKKYTDKDWEAKENYDMVLNVTRLGIDGVVDILAKIYEG
uniref:cytidylate kinase-like family protein n=1 Tax=Agathobacter sp. TaxID=2021311 RepID=UPI004056F190